MDNKIDTRLAEIKAAILAGQTQYPEGGKDHLKWMYYCLINGIQTGLYPSKSIGIDSDASKKAHFLFVNYKDVPPSLNEWIAKYCIKAYEGSYVPFGSATRSEHHPTQNQSDYTYHHKIIDFGKFGQNDSEKANAIYEFHKRAIQTYEAASKIDIKIVHSFLESPQWPKEKNAGGALVKAPTFNELIATIPAIPSVDEAGARSQASKVNPNDYQTVDEYAKDIGIQLRKAIAIIAHFTVSAALTPQQTINVVEDILELRAGLSNKTLNEMTIQSQNGIARLLGRVRPLPFKDSPIFKMVQAAQKLPDCALVDSKMHADHIAVLQKGLEIIHGYDDALKHYIDALKVRQEELTSKVSDGHPQDDVSTKDIASALLTDSVGDKLKSLNLSRAFARAHAGNFATTMRVILQSKGEKEQISGLAANILLPLQQAQRAFMVYQSSKFGQVAGFVNDLDGQTLPKPEQAENLLAQSLGTLTLMIEKMKDDLRLSNDAITTIATQTDNAVASGQTTEIALQP